MFFTLYREMTDACSSLKASLSLSFIYMLSPSVTLEIMPGENVVTWRSTFLGHFQPGTTTSSSRQVSSDGFQLTAASPNFWAAAFLTLPAIPRAVSVFYTDCAGNPPQLISIENSDAYHPLSLHCWTRSWYLAPFLLPLPYHNHPWLMAVLNLTTMWANMPLST